MDKIIFSTTLDWYKNVRWPRINHIPPIGSTVYVSSEYRKFCSINNIPQCLIVQGISIEDTKDEWGKLHSVITIELYYDKHAMTIASIDRFNHLMRQ